MVKQLFKFCYSCLIAIAFGIKKAIDRKEKLQHVNNLIREYQSDHGIESARYEELLEDESHIYDTIENIIKSNVLAPKNDLVLNLDLIEQVKRIFSTPNIKKDYPRLKWEKIEYDKIEELLVEQHNFSKNRVVNALDRLKKLDSSSKQVSLDSFFGSK